jgi:hypothetical protein
MKVELFVLCDAATDYQGKLNILGTFDSLWVREVPAVHPFCAVAIRLRFQRVEEGDHRVRITIVDEDGTSVVNPVDTTIAIQFHHTPRMSLATNMILNLQGLKFPAFGEYSLDLALDGRQEASLPLYVHQMSGHQSSGQPGQE